MDRRLKLSAWIALLAACLALPATATAGVLPPLDPDPPIVEVPELPDDPLPPLPPLLPPVPPPPPLPGVDPAPIIEPPGVTSPITVPSGLTVGEPLVLQTTARSPGASINSIAIDFDDGGGFLAMSASRLRPPDAAFENDRSTTFSVPYAFTRPGLHTLQVTLGSGDCGAARQTTTQTIEVNVAGLARVRASGTASTAGRACRHADTLPARGTRGKVPNATVCVLNNVRRQRGMRPFRTNKKLRRAAAMHTRYMLRGRFFAHQGPGEPSLGERFRRVGYRGGGGENLGTGAGIPYATARGMVTGWMNSPPHRANILEPRFRWIGVVIRPARPYVPPVPGATYTAEFGTTRR